MKIINMLGSLWRNTDLFYKLLFTLFVVTVYRLGTFISVVGINVSVLKSYMENSSVAGSLLGFIDLFTAGNLSQCTLFGLGIMPSITASIVMQLAGYSIPAIEELGKEGEYGRTIIGKYTRFLAFGLSLVYSVGFAFYLESIPGIVFHPGVGFKMIMMVSLSAGSMFVMWLGDQIKLLGVGNGSSIILFAGIVARFPTYFIRTLHAVNVGSISSLTSFLILAIFCALILCVVFLEKGFRQIPVSYARRVTGNKIYGGQTSYIPFKINTVGIMPVIFATSFLNMPLFVFKILAKYEMFSFLGDVFSPRGLIYNIIMFGLIMIFKIYYLVTTTVLYPCFTHVPFRGNNPVKTGCS